MREGNYQRDHTRNLQGNKRHEFPDWKSSLSTQHRHRHTPNHIIMNEF